jgi:hypothetical protein
MSELSKNQLTTENNNSFPNNNTGYITPTLLRTFNQNMIDSLVDEQTYTTDSGSFNARINALDPSGSAQALIALEQATASLNAYTASQNSFNSSATASIVALQNWSSSLDATYATDAELSASVSALSSSVTVTTNGLSSSIGSLSSSIAVTDLAQSQSIAALQQFSSSLDTTFATDTQLSASASTLQNNINTKLDSASFNSYTASASSNTSASISALSQSIAVTDLAQSSSIAQLLGFSSSLDTTFATDAQLSASASTLQNNINTLSSSVAVTTLGLSSSVAALQQFSSSLDSTFATDAQLSASASTLQNDINTRLLTSSFNTYTSSITTQLAGIGQAINTKLNTSSFNSYTQSVVNPLIAATASYAQTTFVVSVSQSIAATDFTQSQQIAALQGVSGSYATTGSNTFNGNQIVSGNVNIAGNITAVSASFTYVTTIFETASVIFSSGSNQFGDELSDVQTLSGSVRVQGGLTVNGVPVQTSSFDASGYLLTSSFNTYTQSAASGVSASINSATQSLSSSIATTTNDLSSSIGNLSSSVAVTTNNLDLEVNQKLDSSSFNSYTQSNDTKVNALIAQTGSYAISSSVAATFDAFSSSISLTYATETELSASASTLQNGINSKVENSTFNTYTQSQAAVNAGLTTAIGIRLLTSSFNTYTSSNDGKVNSLIAATGSYITSAQTSSMTVLSASYSETASYALNTQNIDTGSLVTTASFNAYTQSASTNVSASINSATQSLSSSIATTTNLLDLEVNGKLDSSSFNTYTQSNDSVVNALVAATASYVTEAETGSFITSAQTSSMSVLSSSFAVTASFALNVTPTDVSMFVSQSTFNAYTQSNNSVVNALVSATSSYAISSSVAAIDAVQDGQINSLIAQTSSYVTESETGSFARVNVSNVFTQNQTISGNLDVTGKITALSASITYLETIYQTSSVVYSSGSNILGDELSDTQTLSGSVLVQGLLRVNGVAPILVGATASYASASISSSYALSASFALSSSNTISSSFAQTASIANNVVVRARNGNASTLGVGTVVHITGASGDNPIFNTASFTSEALSSNTLGILRNSLASGVDGEVIVNGIVLGVNTDPALGYVAGDIIYLSSSGEFTRVQPQAPQQIVTLGQVLRAQQNNGSIYVNISNGWELDELHNVAINGVADGDLLVYRSATSLWTNSSSAELGLVNTSSFNSYTSSESSNVSASINSATSSLSASLTLTDNQKLATSSFNTYTSSIATQISGLGTAIAGKVSLNSPVNPQTITGSLIISGTSTNGGGETLALYGKGDGIALHVYSGSVEVTSPQGTGHFYTNLPITSSGARINGLARFSGIEVIGLGGAAGSGSIFVQNDVTASNISASENIYANTVFATVLNGTASFATNAATAQTASYVLQSVSASFASFANTASFALNVPTINTSSFATTGSNIFIGTQTITGSVILSSSADIELTVIGNTIISGNLLVTGSNINLEVDPPALSIGVTNVKTLLDATASGVVTTEDIYRTGAGPTGDLSGVRLQTLSGSDTTNDTLLSRISTGVNRNTSTGIVGSVVNSIITSTWATGSGGGRVAFSSNVIANAQSASSTLTLNAGNPSSNFAGGTASLAAGRVNIGTTGATITSTGSWTQQGSIVTSGGITVNNLGITATSGSINGDFRVSGSVNISGSNPTQLWTSGGLNLSGSLISNITDIYTGSNNANFIVTLGSASMASLIAAGTVNPNTLYFVI